MKLPSNSTPDYSLSQWLGKWLSGRIKRYYYRLVESTAGSHKRDLLVTRVEIARDSLEQTRDQFQSALEKFSSLVHHEGGDLLLFYKDLKREFNRSEQKAQAVRNHIDTIEDLATALFQEWEQELEHYSNRTLRGKSRQKMKLTQRHYKSLISAMRKAESKIDPVLNAFRDQVLYLKHNLNAQAIAALQHELTHVSMDIATMIEVMDHSILQAKQFMNTLEEPPALPAK